MSSRPLTAVVFVGAVLFGSAMADADPLPSPVTSPGNNGATSADRPSAAARASDFSDAPCGGD